jgi:mannose-1-phosphate guanylyltransferase
MPPALVPRPPRPAPSSWSAIILAGGDGTRLRPLTRAMAGDDRPKQFCPVLGDETLVDQTRRRVSMLVAPERTLTVVTHHHERYYSPALADVPARLIVVQPESRGTAPAIVYGLLRLLALADDGPVALFPSDHYLSDDRVFMWSVEQALETVARRPSLTVLLGIAADRPEVEYGWIEPGHVIADVRAPLYAVRRFWEKPARRAAERLLAQGCFWNSFVLVARPSTLLRLVERAVPSLIELFGPLRASLATPWETGAAEAVYAALLSIDFSRAVLVPSAARLAVLPVTGVEWSDLGDPARVVIVRQRLARQLDMA